MYNINKYSTNLGIDRSHSVAVAHCTHARKPLNSPSEPNQCVLRVVSPPRRAGGGCAVAGGEVKKKGFRAKNGPWDSIHVARGVAGGAGGVVGVPPGVVVALVGVVGGGEGADSACSGWGGFLLDFDASEAQSIPWVKGGGSNPRGSPRHTQREL